MAPLTPSKMVENVILRNSKMASVPVSKSCGLRSEASHPITRTAADDYAFLGMLFQGYRNAHSSTSRSVDISHIKQEVREATAVVEEEVMLRPFPVLRGGMATPESWEECLEYYEVQSETLMEESDKNMEAMVELELWFLRIIEPCVGDVDAWKSRELYKCTHYHTIYLPPPLRDSVGKAVHAKLSKTAFFRILQGKIEKIARGDLCENEISEREKRLIDRKNRISMTGARTIGERRKLRSKSSHPTKSK